MASVAFRPSVPSANPATGMSQPVQVIDQCGHVFESSFIDKLYYQAVQAGRELRCPVSQLPINRQKLEVVRNAAEGDLAQITRLMSLMLGEFRELKIDFRVKSRQLHNLQNISCLGQMAITLPCITGLTQASYMNAGVDREEIAREIDAEAAARGLPTVSAAPMHAEPAPLPATVSPDRYAVPEREEEPGAVREDDRYVR